MQGRRFRRRTPYLKENEKKEKEEGKKDKEKRELPGNSAAVPSGPHRDHTGKVGQLYRLVV